MRANVLGDAVHKACEHYMQTGEIWPTVTLPAPYLPPGGPKEETFQTLEFVQAVIDHVPPHAKDPYWQQFPTEAGNGVMVEQLGEMGTYEGGPAWIQYIDLVVAQPGDVGEIIDYKTRSSFRYSKTPEELLHDAQLMSNARWLFLSSDYKTVRVKHLNLLTRGKVKCVPTFVEVTREQVEEEWQRTLATVREMVEWAAIASEADKLPPNTESCDMYGGCRKRAACGFDKPVTLRRFSEMSTAGGIALLNSLLPAIGAAPAAQVAPSAPVVGLVVPATGSAPPPAAPRAGLSLSALLPPAGPQATPVAPATPATPATPAAPTPVVGLVVPATGPATSPPPPVVSSLSALLKPKEQAQPLPAGPSAAPAPAPSAEAQASAVAAGYPVDFSPAGGIVPPDAPPRTSTPEQVAAADAGNKEAPASEPSDATGVFSPEETQALAAAEKPKRTRRTKAEMEAARAAAPAPITIVPVDAAVAAALSAAVSNVSTAVDVPNPASAAPATIGFPVHAPAISAGQPSPAGASVVTVYSAPPASAAPPVDPLVAQIKHMLKTPDPQFACPVKYVFIDCLPGKGWPAEDAPVDAREFWHGITANASSQGKVADYRFIRYESKAFLSASVRVMLKGLPHSIYVDSSVPDIQELLTAVVPYAQLVVHGR